MTIKFHELTEICNLLVSILQFSSARWSREKIAYIIKINEVISNPKKEEEKEKKKNKQEKVIPIICFPTSVAEVKILQVRTRKLYRINLS